MNPVTNQSRSILSLFPITLLAILLLFSGCSSPEPEVREPVHILFLAGAPSHGFGNHEHLGGSTVLAETLERANLGITTDVVSGWPEDSTLLDRADAVVFYSDGFGRHPVSGNLDAFQRVMERGVGMVTIHFATDVSAGEPGDRFLEWQGGFFDSHWSVNPFWTAHFEEYPDHPITNGVSPMEVMDEWYFHMRFTEDRDGLTPILSDLPPPESLSRPDGSHTNNPNAREAVLERGEPQHVAWAYQRPYGGRGFGFTGGHIHWNWGIDDFRRLVANAILWTAGGEVPANGVPVHPMTVLELAELTDDSPTPGWNYQAIQEILDQANGRTTRLE